MSAPPAPAAEPAEGAAPASWEAFKTAGNDFYKASKFESAVDSYTQAVECADIGEADKATIICNRAQCRLMLKDYEKAVEDANLVLAVQADNVKALFRRASALEALGKKEDALADFREVRRLQPAVTAAAAGIRRIESELKGGAGFVEAAKGGPRRKITKEEMMQLQELEERVRSVAQQLQVAKDRKQGAASGKRRLELTAEEMSRIPEGTKTYEAVGKMFVMTPLDEVKAHLADKVSAQEKRLKNFEASIEYLEKASKEADSNWMEMVNTIRKA
uniref:Uncharacterized protein n=1 Tax=Bicosoecida sp. CB-2014 TaxID=1486930 RepID=A0A7S1G8S4_9STRA|eukprot:CAMPEP_0203817206 /NCGR_PEP_ID=MMETSP0115-20131106/21214_1 /ASSEMBLY_ACC=CAM_ASM_000227 /TAXON_ID=33651 /ORGANISM="Bicosoecid sp, Strain ms1" /LENGTH=274 /DNA_ID=CAMNT_0050726127 /DNA_START=82 /DNA_END=906 /DNA_ORIENTATION=-